MVGGLAEPPGRPAAERLDHPRGRPWMGAQRAPWGQSLASLTSANRNGLGFLLVWRIFCCVKPQERLGKGKGEEPAGLQGKGLGGL